MLTIILKNIKLHYQLLCKNMFFNSIFNWNKTCMTKTTQIQQLTYKPKPLNKRSRFQKNLGKRTIKFGVHMRKKYSLQNLIPDQKEKDDSHICSSLQSHVVILYKIMIIEYNHEHRPGVLVGHPRFIAMIRVRITSSLCSSPLFYSNY